MKPIKMIGIFCFGKPCIYLIAVLISILSILGIVFGIKYINL